MMKMYFQGKQTNNTNVVIPLKQPPIVKTNIPNNKSSNRWSLYSRDNFGAKCSSCARG